LVTRLAIARNAILYHTWGSVGADGEDSIN
jgi:hypothetical protein